MITVDTDRLAPFIKDSEPSGGIQRAMAALGSILRREGTGSDMLGWLRLPFMPERDLENISDTAKRIQDENDCLVVIGIGGSYMGARAAIEALPDSTTFPVIFAGNSLSPEYHDRLLSHLDGRRFAICVISKSGTTMEPAIVFRLLRRMMLERFGRPYSSGRIIAITDPNGGALRMMAEKEDYKTFPIPPDVGGRYSVLSPVGLLPCAAAGIPIKEMMKGAESGMREFTAEESSNAALRYAASRILLHEMGIAIELLSTFHPELSAFCEWWKQLAGESEGKEGKGLFPASAIMTTDLHSLGQFIQEGSGGIMETFLVAAKPNRDLAIPHEEDDLDDLNYLAGRPLGEINSKAYKGTLDAHAAGGRPVITIEIPQINAGTIGMLYVFFEIAVAVSGHLMGINPFDQPGVEEYKKRMFRLLGKPGVS